MGTHLRELSEGYLINTNMTGFRWFTQIFVSLYLLTKVALARAGNRLEKNLLEGLLAIFSIATTLDGYELALYLLSFVMPCLIDRLSE